MIDIAKTAKWPDIQGTVQTELHAFRRKQQKQPLASDLGNAMSLTKASAERLKIVNEDKRRTIQINDKEQKAKEAGAKHAEMKTHRINEEEEEEEEEDRHKPAFKAI